jgi:thymidylate synthase (FAD)
MLSCSLNIDSKGNKMIEVTYIDHMGSDLSVVNAARVSFNKKSDWIPKIHNGEKNVLSQADGKLIHYLARHKHTSPFGHCFASFHVRAPVFVARQLVKHKFLRWNEVSRRYVDDDPEFYVPDQWRGRADNVKQGSYGSVDLDPELAKNMVESSTHDYKYLLAKGVCPEQARMILPQSMMTEWYWSGSLDAFADMCRLRGMPDTQAESREVASHISDKMMELFPTSWAALRGYGQ